MTTEPVPLVVVRPPMDSPCTLPTWSVLCALTRTLNIPEDALMSCDTIYDVHLLARHQYRILAKRYHPDIGPYVRAEEQRSAALARTGSTDETKECRKCHVVKTLDAFQTDRHMPGKKRHVCKACNNPQRAVRAMRGSGPSITVGVQFQRLTRAYRTIMAYPAHLQLSAMHRVARTRRQRQLPIMEMALPWALERHAISLGYGWQESMERYWY